jgi:hypothetical protein
VEPLWRDDPVVPTPEGEVIVVGVQLTHPL